MRSQKVRTFFLSTESQESKSEVLSISAIWSRASHSRSSDVSVLCWQVCLKFYFNNNKFNEWNDNLKVFNSIKLETIHIPPISKPSFIYFNIWYFLVHQNGNEIVVLVSNLDKILKLSDQNKDRFLNKHEFTAACHLASRSFYYCDEIPDQVAIYGISSLINYTFHCHSVTPSTCSCWWLPAPHTCQQEGLWDLVWRRGSQGWPAVRVQGDYGAASLHPGKIWKLSDQGQDGKLDRYEFSIYHHLTRRAYYYGDEIPDQVVISPHSSYSIIILYISPQLSREYLASISN